MNTLIGQSDIWSMAAIIIGWAAISIILEQKYQWAAKITGAVIALIGAMILSNLNIIPMDSDFEGIVWSYIVPLSIPMLLFKANLVKIWRESGRMLIIFLISSVGTVLGAILGIFVIGKFMPEAATVAAMMTGSYIGGSVNFAAMADSFQASGDIVSAAVVADNLVMVIYIMILIALPAMSFFRKNYKTPYVDKVEEMGSNSEDGESQVAKYWGRKEISLKDIATTFAIAVGIVAFSSFFSTQIKEIFTGSDVFSIIMSNFFGNMYLILTTVTLILATVFNKFFDNLKGSQEIGTFGIYIFFVVIGIPASIPKIITNAPILLVFAAIMVIINMLVTFIAAKTFKFSLEEGIVASNANIGGPTTAAALAISKGWTELVAPVMLVGTLGYVFGNYFGIFIEYMARIILGG
ncbi:putative membrane protein [Bacilli bacterium PM5-3]|nr:putative membrane protein [Bacilli bacterium PM5-3]MDH6604159.1 putative membrane protein [Bacilli bacterium PM5-9]